MRPYSAFAFFSRLGIACVPNTTLVPYSMSEYMITNEFLSKHSMFGGLSEHQLDLVKPYLVERTYPKGTILLTQGENNNSVYFIVDGTVAVVRQSETKASQQRLITTLTSGDSFGEMELIDIQRCAASVITQTEATIVTLTNQDLYALSLVDLKTYTMLILNLARDISRRLRHADEMLALVKSRKTMASRPEIASQ